MERVHAFPENIGVGGVRRVDVEDYGGGGELGEGFDGDRDDGGEGAGSATFESPEKIGVGLGVCDEEFTRGGDYLEGQGLVCGFLTRGV